jgi:hypothetical protein
LKYASLKFLIFSFKINILYQKNHALFFIIPKKTLVALVLSSVVALPAAFADVNSDAENYGQEILNQAIDAAKAGGNQESMADTMENSTQAKYDEIKQDQANLGDINTKACNAQMDTLQGDANTFSVIARDKEYKVDADVDGNKVMGLLTLVADAMVDGSSLVYDVCDDTPTAGYFVFKAYDFALTTGNDYFTPGIDNLSKPKSA